jgi:hypothetical protein
MMRGARPLCALALAIVAAASHAQEFKFDAAAFERKTFEFSGYAELKAEHIPLNRDGAFYKLNFYDKAQRESVNRQTVTLKPQGKLRLGEHGTFNLRAHLDVQRDSLSEAHAARFDEAYWSYKPVPGFTLDAGKSSMKWGKGYAWNPVGFVERQKDPNDPELAREGFTALSADIIRNFDGPLQTVAFTPLLLPVSRGINSDFGTPGHVNVAGKLYLLYRDTDIDFMFLSGGSRTRRFGLDFSRNLGTNLEIHGEWARAQNVSRPVTDARGNVTQVTANATSYLAGVRYLTEIDTTYIVEYYRNGAGYSQEQSSDFYRFVDSGVAQFNASGNSALLRKALTLSQGAYGRPNTGRNYLYFRATQKEPFDFLYFSPAVTVIQNLDDGSRSLVPEAVYTGFTNIELRARAFFLTSGGKSEFGEKQNSRRVELLARFYF